MNDLYHYGIKGMKWGVRRFQNEDGTLTSEGKSRYSKEVLFVSGSSKTQDVTSNYYRKNLSDDIKNELDKHIKSNTKIIVGDAPGIDRQVQDYLKNKKYSNVEIYSPGKEVRYLADPKWKINQIDAPEYEVGSKEWLAKKDIAMTNVATLGLAVILDYGSTATRKNVQRLIEQNKSVKVYELSSKGKQFDKMLKKIDNIINGKE